MVRQNSEVKFDPITCTIIRWPSIRVVLKKRKHKTRSKKKRENFDEAEAKPRSSHFSTHLLLFFMRVARSALRGKVRVRVPRKAKGNRDGDLMGVGKEQLGLLVGLLLALLRCTAGLSVTVSDVECVYENVQYEGDRVSGNFVVVGHDTFWGADHPGIDFVVTAPAGNVVFSLKGTSGDKFQFIAPRSGMYKFCFQNSFSALETISFYIHVGHIPTEHDLAKDEHLDPINVRIAMLREALESVSAEQRYLKARDARHRHTNESTRKRLIRYTLTEYLALILASGVQVFLVRRLFSKSVAYNRV